MSATMPSGKNEPDTTADEVPPDIDAYAIDIPDAFIEGFAGETVAEKLRAAEQAPSTTDRSDMGQCPACGSVRLSPKPGGETQREHGGSLVCTTCRAHLGIPGGAGSFGDSAQPTEPTQWVAPAPWTGTFHVVDGCAALSAAAIEATAAGLQERGLEPCDADACQPDAAWEACDACGRPTFGAVEGIPLTVCGECVVVSDDA